MTYSKELEEIIRRFFLEDDWHYDFDEEYAVFKGGVEIEGKLKSVRFFLRVRDSVVVNRVVIPLNAEEDKRAAVGEFVARANYGMTLGGFDFDFNDGEISFRMTATLADLRENPTDALRLLLMLPCKMVEQYGDGLLSVMFGFLTPQEAVEKSESKSESADE